MSDRQLIADLLSALEYHTEQTRPIEFSKVAIEAAREYLSKPAQQEPVAWLPSAEWTACVKLPVTVHVRQQRPGETHVSTREGITPVKPDDLIMRGVSGEEYPIGREIFERTYRMGEAAPAQQQDGETITQMFTGLPKRKLNELLAAGWQINGVCLQRTEEDGTVRRGAVTTGGMVLWWNQPAQQEPVAWMYDQAKYRENDLRGRQWAFNCFSQNKPWVDDMVRNLTPLYTRHQARYLKGMMMNKQHEALRLAEKMESYSLRSGYAWHCHKAAAELRRLHQSEHEGWRYANELEQERKRLHEANKTMLDALKAIELYIPTTTAKDGGAARYSMNVIAADLVRAAIAKAIGEQS